MSQRPAPRIISTRCSLLASEASSTSSPARDSILAHHFSQKLHIFAAAPRDKNAKLDINKTPTLAPGSFSMATIHAATLLEPDFMATYIKKGKLYLLAVDQSLGK